MTDITMKALRNHPFGTGIRQAGEEYDATASEAKVLEALGWAQRADAPKKAEAAKPAPAVTKAANPPARKAAKKAQGYRTRDMKARK